MAGCTEIPSTHFSEKTIHVSFSNWYTDGLTRNVSPTIQAGAELPPDSTKKAPRQVFGDNWVSRKSAGLMGQSLPPNASVTLTEVEHATKSVQSVKPIRGHRMLTVRVITVEIARRRLCAWYLSVYISYCFRRPSNQCCACVYRSKRSGTGWKRYRIALDVDRYLSLDSVYYSVKYSYGLTCHQKHPVRWFAVYVQIFNVSSEERRVYKT